jgi:hypothetical protein
MSVGNPRYIWFATGNPALVGWLKRASSTRSISRKDAPTRKRLRTSAANLTNFERKNEIWKQPNINSKTENTKTLSNRTWTRLKKFLPSVLHHRQLISQKDVPTRKRLRTSKFSSLVRPDSPIATDVRLKLNTYFQLIHVLFFLLTKYVLLRPLKKVFCFKVQELFPK